MQLVSWIDFWAGALLSLGLLTILYLVIIFIRWLKGQKVMSLVFSKKQWRDFNRTRQLTEIIDNGRLISQALTTIFILYDLQARDAKMFVKFPDGSLHLFKIK